MIVDEYAIFIMQLIGLINLLSYNHELYGDIIPLRNFFFSKLIADAMASHRHQTKSKNNYFIKPGKRKMTGMLMTYKDIYLDPLCTLNLIKLN